MSGFGGYGPSPHPGQEPGSGQGGGQGAGGYGSGGYGTPPAGGYGSGGYGQGGPQDAAAPPVCPRHPDRISYVTCQRCGRPACPECQRPATVGVHCVDCARTAAKQRRPVRTVAGGVDRGGNPIVTYTIMAICIVLELTRYLAEPLYSQVIAQLILWPEGGYAEPYRLLTTTLLHGGIMHLAFNMYALYLVGGDLERMLGRARYLSLYVLAALGGSIAYLLLAGGSIPAVGASGGVFGLFGAFAVLLRRFGRDTRQILVVIAINAVIGFVISGIAWQAHLGGLVVGAAVAALFAYVPRERVWLQWTGAGVLAAVLAAAGLALLA